MSSVSLLMFLTLLYLVPLSWPLSLCCLVPECEDGRYGEGCGQNCSCHHGACDRLSGKCICHVGWMGEHCDAGEGSSFFRGIFLACASAISCFCCSMEAVSVLCLNFPLFCRQVRNSAGMRAHQVSMSPGGWSLLNPNTCHAPYFFMSF